MLDPRGRREVIATVRRLNREYGITVVLITHYMDEAVQCDRVVVMEDGKILLDGLPKSVFSHVAVLKEVGLDGPQGTDLFDGTGRREAARRCHRRGGVRPTAGNAAGKRGNSPCKISAAVQHPFAGLQLNLSLFFQRQGSKERVSQTWQS